jgi:hypothetical protein
MDRRPEKAGVSRNLETQLTALASVELVCRPTKCPTWGRAAAPSGSSRYLIADGNPVLAGIFQARQGAKKGALTQLDYPSIPDAANLVARLHRPGARRPVNCFSGHFFARAAGGWLACAQGCNLRYPPPWHPAPRPGNQDSETGPRRTGETSSERRGKKSLSHF